MSSTTGAALRQTRDITGTTPAEVGRRRDRSCRLCVARDVARAVRLGKRRATHTLSKFMEYALSSECLSRAITGMEETCGAGGKVQDRPGAGAGRSRRRERRRCAKTMSRIRLSGEARRGYEEAAGVPAAERSAHSKGQSCALLRTSAEPCPVSASRQQKKGSLTLSPPHPPTHTLFQDLVSKA